MDQTRNPSHYTRREFGKLALAGVPASLVLANRPLSAFAEIKSTIKGVQIGAITYSFNRLTGGPEAIIDAFVKLGLGEMELMSNHAETLAGANLHFKDMHKPPTKGYTPFGQGDAPLKDVLLLVSKEKYNFPVNIEFEYQGDPMVEMPKCFQFVKDALG